MTRYPYTVELQPDGSYLVQFLDFPEGFTDGSTPEEAAVFADEVLDLLLATYLDMGKAIPTPSEVGDLPFSVADISGCQSRTLKVAP